MPPKSSPHHVPPTRRPRPPYSPLHPASHCTPASPSSFCCRKGTPSGPETGLLSNTQKWIVWGDTSADKARDFIGKGHLGGEQQAKGTQENSSAMWLAGFMVMGLVSRLSLANHSDLRVLPGGSCLVQPRWMPERRILGGGRTCGVSFWPSPNSSGCWRLISSVFLTRTSCRETTHANGYYGAWPGWVVSISVLLLTL